MNIIKIRYTLESVRNLFKTEYKMQSYSKKLLHYELFSILVAL
jgi:hypothetical protein